MKFCKPPKCCPLVVIFCFAWLFTSVLRAQDKSVVLRGQVTDPSGAAITNANVVITPLAGSPVTTETGFVIAGEFNKAQLKAGVGGWVPPFFFDEFRPLFAHPGINEGDINATLTSRPPWGPLRSSAATAKARAENGSAPSSSA